MYVPEPMLRNPIRRLSPAVSPDPSAYFFPVRIDIWPAICKEKHQRQSRKFLLQFAIQYYIYNVNNSKLMI